MSELIGKDKIVEIIAKSLGETFNEPNAVMLVNYTKEIIDIVQQSQLEKLSMWAIREGLATGHADTINDLLKSLSIQTEELREKARLSDLQVQMNTDNN